MGDLFAKGYNGQVTVSGDWLTIARKGFGRIGHSKGDRRIPRQYPSRADASSGAICEWVHQIHDPWQSSDTRWAKRCDAG